MVSMLALSSGGGGGGGFTRAAGNAGGGGAGGACSGVARFTCPANLLPDVLYVAVYAGGLGGAASANGSTGVNSLVLTSKTAASPNIVLSSGANPPGGGTAGTGAAGGTGGTVPSVAATQPLHIWGQWAAIVGIVGGAGGAQTGAIGTNITAWAAITLSPGSGGAGCTTTNFNGGDQRASALLDMGAQGYYLTGASGISPGGTGTGAAIDGGGGIRSITPFFNCGGTGGGSNNSAQAGNGGTGGYGCGGGGGGAGATAGAGGSGGDGLVIIYAW